MHTKNERIAMLESALIERFGSGAYSPEGSERLGSNHQVFRSRSNHELEISVVAGGEGQTEDRYSVQVEVRMREPDLDIPLVANKLSLA